MGFYLVGRRACKIPGASQGLALTLFVKPLYFLRVYPVFFIQSFNSPQTAIVVQLRSIVVTGRPVSPNLALNLHRIATSNAHA